MKQCADCKREGLGPKPESEYHAGRYKGGTSLYCKDHENRRVRIRYALGPQKIKGRVKLWRAATGYNKCGATAEQRERMFIEQGGKCFICFSPENGRRLAVDHCHATGKIRGLLCHRCNLSLGLMLDDPIRFRNAANYLESHV